MDQPSQLTALIQRAQRGEPAAQSELYTHIYAELHRVAERLVGAAPPIAAPSSLVHEGYLRLFDKGQLRDVPNRRYFFFAASRKMRDILVERLRKRGPPVSPLDTLADQFLEDFQHKTRWEFLAVHNVLDRFTKSRNVRKRRRHELIELTFFSGLSRKEAAKVLGISYAQAGEDQRLALAELAVEIKQMEP